MYDRQPTKPGRVLITPEDGTAPFYAVLARADEPTDPGTPYNKATQLTDETSALLGGAETVNEALVNLISKIMSAKDEAVQQALNDGVKIEIGDYKGTGGVGQTKPTTIKFSFNPKFVYVCQTNNDTNYYMVAAQGQLIATTSPFNINANANLIWGNNQLQFYVNSTDAKVQLNKSGYDYIYIAIG